MLSAPLARDPDISRLLDDGYDIAIQGNHLVVRHIPYVDERKVIRYGFLAYPVTVSGDLIVPQSQHEIWLGGGRPCNEYGKPLTLATPSQRDIVEGLRADFMLSSKPSSGHYSDQYAKVTAYVRILTHEAHAIDPSVTATPGAAWQDVGEDSPFVYRDTATSRTGLATVSKCFSRERITIVGLGGTGSYILDQVAKTPVAAITIIDGDTFENHNAFRAPGAASLEILRTRPKKVEYYKGIYCQMHTNIAAHEVFLDEDNLHLLDGSTFVFLASDDAAAKPAILAWLDQHGVPFIDVGMGVEEVDGHLTGLLRVTTSLPSRDGQVHDHSSIPAPAPDMDDYGRNIQVADLNAMNALIAVIRWKRHLGFYADGTRESNSTYSLFANEIANEDK